MSISPREEPADARRAALRSGPEHRRRQLVDAALRVIARQGLAAATVRAIAREAGFTTGVVSYYFPDKQAVVVACLEAASFDWLAEATALLAAAAGPEERLAALIRVAIPESPDWRAEWRIWLEMWTYAGRDAAFRQTMIAIRKRWPGLIHEVLAEAEAAGLIAPELDLAVQAEVMARLADGLGVHAWFSAGWEHATRVLVAYVCSLGLPGPAQTRLRAATGCGD